MSGRLFPGDTIVVMPNVNCRCTTRTGRCDGGNDEFAPALWHRGSSYVGVVADVHGFDTVVVDHDGGRDFVPYDNCHRRADP